MKWDAGRCLAGVALAMMAPARVGADSGRRGDIYGARHFCIVSICNQRVAIGVTYQDDRIVLSGTALSFSPTTIEVSRRLSKVVAEKHSIAGCLYCDAPACCERR